MKEITKDDITEMALHDMLTHDLTDVEFCWGSSKKYLGFVKSKFDKHNNPVPARIELSNFFWRAVEDKWEFVDVWLHELAHALAIKDHGFNGCGHGEVWQEYAVKLGASPTACSDAPLSVDGFKYYAYCPTPDCGYQFGFSRMGKTWKRTAKSHLGRTYICPRCKTLLMVVQNY